MRKKKTVFHIVLLLLFLHGWTYFVYAKENVEITSDTTFGQNGDIVDISFVMENNPGTTMYELYIEYDTEALEVVSIEDGGGYPEWFDMDVTISPLYISAGDALSLKNSEECHTLATIRFKIKDEALAGEYHFSVKGLFLNADLDEFEVLYNDTGCITVTSSKETDTDKGETFHDSENSNESKNEVEESNGSSTDKNINNQKTDNTDSTDNKNNLEESQNSQINLDIGDNNNQLNYGVEETNSTDIENAYTKNKTQKKHSSIIFSVILAILVLLAAIGGSMIYHKKRK